MPMPKRINATQASRGVTWADVLRSFDDGSRPDSDFARDMRRVRRSRPRLRKDPWARSSTRRS